MNISYTVNLTPPKQLLEGIEDNVAQLISLSLDVYISIIREQYYECFIRRPYLVGGSLDPIAYYILKNINTNNNKLSIQDVNLSLNATNKESKRIISEIIHALYRANKIDIDPKTNKIISYEKVVQKISINQIIKGDKFFFLPCSNHLFICKMIEPPHLKKYELEDIENNYNLNIIDFKKYDKYDDDLREKIAESCKNRYKGSDSSDFGNLGYDRIETLQRCQLLNTKDELLKPEVFKIRPLSWWYLTRCIISMEREKKKSPQIRIFRFKQGLIENDFTKYTKNLVLSKPEIIESLLNHSVCVNKFYSQ